MKKVIKSMLALAVATFAFTSCEDVPEPYTIPGEGGEDPSVVVEPAGSGTAADPYNVMAILDYVNAMAADVESTETVYIKGKIAAISEEFGTQFGNATFTISDDGSNKNIFTVYRALYLGNRNYKDGDTQIQEGDEVVICGKVVNFRGTTPETVSKGAYIYTLNGVGGSGDTPQPSGEATGTGTQSDPYNVAAALEVCEQTGTTESAEVYVKGKISAISEINTSYGNATYTITDEGVGNALTVYRGYALGNKKFTSDSEIKVGDEVIVYGKLVNFKGNTPEFTQGNYIYSLNGKTDGGGDDTPSEVKVVTIAEFNAAEESTSVWYQLTGTVKNLKDGDKYGNFDLEDATGSVYVYGLLSEKGGSKQQFQSLVAEKGIKEGCTLTIIGNRGSYNDKIEVVNAYFVSIEGGDEPNPNPDPEPNGSFGTLDGNVLTLIVSTLGVENSKAVPSVKLVDGTTITFDGGGNNNAPKYYDKGTSIRMYPKNIMTINGNGKTIASLKLTCSEDNGTLCNAAEQVSSEPGSVTFDGNDVNVTVNNGTATITNTNTSTGAASQLRFTTLVITYSE